MPPENTSTSSNLSIGQELWNWANDLFPICRSLTGEGNRQTLNYLKQIVPSLNTHEVPTGTKAFDWNVPDEWTIRGGHITDPEGNKVVDFADNNLHVVGYSEPVNRSISLDELQQHLHSIPDLPDAIPYVTSYYARNWGFCMADAVRRNLPNGKYQVVIDASLAPGNLTYGEVFIPSTDARQTKEVLLSTYICHPSLANNELSGPVVVAALCRWLSGLGHRRYNYRCIFIPETIGSLVYLSRHLEQLKQNVVAGYVVTCVGDDKAYSYLPSRAGNTLADRAATHVLGRHYPGFVRYEWRDRGSDERQYCSPGADLPVASVMRSKYGAYPEYHTSDDNMRLISPGGLGGAFSLYKKILMALEENFVPLATCIGEPQLGRHGLYPTTSFRGSADNSRHLLDVLTYADGSLDLLDIGDKLNTDIFTLANAAQQLRNCRLIRDGGERP